MNQLKRETSLSVDSLHAVSDQIKRLAIEVGGEPRDRMSMDCADTKSQPATESADQSQRSAPAPFSLQVPQPADTLISILSDAETDFSDKYEILNEVGRGAFSIVYKCRHKATNTSFAVKTIDLRPLRLRERFNPARIRREVDIMRRLNHPNIIQFVDVFETTDQLMMVMEYCPGTELFDVILSRKYLSETDAKPIFAQIARALFYLHSLNIIHRDIKPENVLILNDPDPVTGLPVAKLLDFGLSKSAGNSAAKTFVGTPCYLAPEVEYTSRGLGGTYGLSADCWSLGAVLYVMLVARFPEFEEDMNGKLTLRLPPALWDDISTDAKDLIRSLMNSNPLARCTASAALQHKWLGPHRASVEELSRTALANYDLGHGLQVEEEALALQEGYSAHGEVKQQAMVIRNNNPQPVGGGMKSGGGGSNNAGAEQPPFQLAPLLHLQRSIATCFEEAHACYQELPEVATKIRKGAVLCRQQLTESTKMLRQVEKTAAEVLLILPDLEMAVEEGEPKLATDFFDIVRGWVVELRELVTKTQQINKASMDQIQDIVEESTQGLQNRQVGQPDVAKLSALLFESLKAQVQAKNAQTQSRLTNGASVDVSAEGPGSDGAAANAGEEDRTLSAEQMLELFVGLFGQNRWDGLSSTANGKAAAQAVASGGAAHGASGSESTPASVPMTQDSFSLSSDCSAMQQGKGGKASMSDSSATLGWVQMESGIFRRDSSLEAESNYLESEARLALEGLTGRNDRSDGFRSDGDFMDDDNGRKGASKIKSTGEVDDDDFDFAIPDRNSFSSPVPTYSGAESSVAGDVGGPIFAGCEVVDATAGGAVGENYSLAHQKAGSPQPLAATRLADALHKLRQVDLILEQLSVFWANTEVVLDVITKKGQHVEQFIGFATKPRLMARFRERLEEYKRFWEGVNMMCSSYIVGVQQAQSPPSPSAPHLYGFLEPHSPTERRDLFSAIGGMGVGVAGVAAFLGNEGFRPGSLP